MEEGIIPAAILVLGAFLLGGLSWGIWQVQKRAATCAAHSRIAGHLASGLGVLCGLGSLALLVWAVLLR